MPEAENTVITTAELAQRLGLTAASLRTYKSKFKDQIIEGEHFVSSESSNLWTAAGEARMRELLRGSATPIDTPINSEIDTPINSPVTGASIDELLQAPADAVAFHLIESRFPSLVHASIHRILNDPTDQDAQRLTAVFDRLGQSLGLLKLSSAFAGGLRHALKTSAESLQAAGLPVPSCSAHLLEGGNQDD